MCSHRKSSPRRSLGPGRVTGGLIALLALPAILLSAPPAGAEDVSPGQTSIVTHSSAHRYPVRGSRSAPLNILYFAPLRNMAVKQIQPLLKQLLIRYRGKIRLQWMSRYREGRYYETERYAALVGREAFRQGGDQLFWKFHDALCALPYLNSLTNPMVDSTARSAGLDIQRLRRAIARRDHDRAVSAERDLSQRLGVPSYNGSPMLLIGTSRYYLSRWTRFQYLDRVVQRELTVVQKLLRKGHPADRIHAKLLALSKKRYKPWRRSTRRSHAPRTTIPKRHKISLGSSPAKGPVSAWVTVVAFMDFTDYNSYKAWKGLIAAQRRYAKRMRLVFKARPRRYSSNALRAARAGHAAAAQGRFWELAHLMFQNRYRLGSASQLLVYAKQAGLDIDRFKRDLKNPRTSQQVLKDLRLARRLSISTAPVVFVDGRRAVTRSFNKWAFEKILKRELKGGLLTRLLGP